MLISVLGVVGFLSLLSLPIAIKERDGLWIASAICCPLFSALMIALMKYGSVTVALAK